MLKLAEFPDWKTRCDILIEEENFSSCVDQSKYADFVHRGVFKFSKDISALIWEMSWSSTVNVDHNKRQFELRIDQVTFQGTSGPQGNVMLWNVYGQPTAHQMIQGLYRAMTCNKMTGKQRVKPHMVKLCYRMRREFKKTRTAMAFLGIECFMQSKEENTEWCTVYGTDPEGYRHL